MNPVAGIILLVAVALITAALLGSIVPSLLETEAQESQPSPYEKGYSLQKCDEINAWQMSFCLDGKLDRLIEMQMEAKQE